MPLLAQVLEAFPDMYFNIDAKEPGVEGPLLDVIADHRAADRVLVASFSEPRLRAVRDIAASDPTRAVATSLGTEAVVRLVGAAKSATNPAWWHVPGPRQGAIAAQVPVHQGPIRVVDERFVATAHTLGLAVHVWTINTVADVLRLLEVGVDGIITDRPVFLRDFLDQRGLWTQPPAPGAASGPRDGGYCLKWRGGPGGVARPPFCVSDALTLFLAVHYSGVLHFAAVSGEKCPV